MSNDHVWKETTCQAPVISGAEERYQLIDGVTVHYLFRPGNDPVSKNPPAILVHGLLGFSYSWRHNITALSDCADIYALDLPGVGYSERLADLGCTFRDMARFLFRFADSLDIPRFDLIATSHGGGVGVLAAAEDVLAHGIEERRVRELVLVAPVNPWASGRRWLINIVSSQIGWWGARAVYPLIARWHGLFLRRVYGDPSRIDPDEGHIYEVAAMIPGTAAHIGKIMKSWRSDVGEMREALGEIRSIPTLLIWGTGDIAVPPSSAEPLAKCFDHVQIKLIEGAGHLPYEELPEQFNAAVSEFLRSGDRVIG